VTEKARVIALVFMLLDEVIIVFTILAVASGVYLLIRSRFLILQYFLLGWKSLSGAMDQKRTSHQASQADAFFLEGLPGIFPGALVGALLARSFQTEGMLLVILLSLPLAMALRYSFITLLLTAKQRHPTGKPQLHLFLAALGSRWAGYVYLVFFLLYTAWFSAVATVPLVTSVLDVSGFQVAIVLSLFFLLIPRLYGKLRPVLVYSVIIASLLAIASFILIILGSTADLPEALSESLAPNDVVPGRLLLGLGVYWLFTEIIQLPTGVHESIRTDYPVRAGLASMMGPLLSAIVAIACFALPDQLFHRNFFSDHGLAGTLLLGSSLFLALSAFISHVRNLFRLTARPALLSGSVQIFFFLLLLAFPVLLGGYLDLQTLLLLGAALGTLAHFPLLLALVLSGSELHREKLRFLDEGHARYEIARDTYLFLWTILPKNLLSRIFGWIAFLRLPRFIMLPLLQAFARAYKINVDEAELELKDYPSLNQFFTRALRDGSRVVHQAVDTFVSPVDGRILQLGRIEKGTMLQAKGLRYTLPDLLDHSEYTPRFMHGSFMIVYLSPQDYHRIHTPAEGQILGYTYSPGRLFMVNQIAVRGIQGLFPKNERLTTYLQTQFGLIAVVKVGATNVGKISVTYDTIQTNRWFRRTIHHSYEKQIVYGRGQELGRFEMGSTVILLFEEGSVEFRADLRPEQKVTFGENLGRFTARRKK